MKVKFIEGPFLEYLYVSEQERVMYEDVTLSNVPFYHFLEHHNIEHILGRRVFQVNDTTDDYPSLCATFNDGLEKIILLYKIKKSSRKISTEVTRVILRRKEDDSISTQRISSGFRL